MGCCRGLCKILLLIWTIVSMLFGIAIIAFMAYRVTDLEKAVTNTNEIYDLLEALIGSGWYSQLNIVELNKYTYFAALGLGALMFIACIIHIISACKGSRCLLGLSTLLLLLTLAADVAGLVFRFDAVESISLRMEISLNETIVSQYHHQDHKDITNSWNILGNLASCCGILSGEDFKYAHNWNGEIKADEPPCGSNIDQGCGETIRELYITSEDIWLTTVIAVKITLLFLLLLHTMCICKMGFNKGGSSVGEKDSYRLVERK